MRLSSFKFIIFDLDNTLFDSLPDYKQLWVDFLGKFLIPKKIAESLYFWLDKIRGAKRQTLNHKIGMFGLFAKTIVWKLMKFGEKKPNLFPSVEELLKKLTENNVILFASSGALETKKRLEKAGISQYFFEAYGKEEGEKSDHIIKMAKKVNLCLGEFCANTASIGDIPSDMKTASSFCIYAIGVMNSELNQYSEKELIDAGAKVIFPKTGDLINLI